MTESTALATREEETGELQVASAVAAVQQEIQGALIVAKQYPRNEDAAYGKLIKACGRPTFADSVTWSYPRGNKQLSGPSIYLAREFARLWGNMRHGFYVIDDTEEQRTIRAWAWDCETNTKVEADDTFGKLNFRKVGGWIKPDERDLRELTNRRAAILKRNCILELLPSDMVDDAIVEATKTIVSKVAKDPDGHRKQVIVGFMSINVDADELEAFLGHKLATCSPTEIAELRAIYKSITDGGSTWAEHLANKTGEAKKGATAADVKEKLKTGNGEKSDVDRRREEGAAELKRREDARQAQDAEVVEGEVKDESRKEPGKEPESPDQDAERRQISVNIDMRINGMQSAADLAGVLEQIDLHKELLGEKMANDFRTYANDRLKDLKPAKGKTRREV